MLGVRSLTFGYIRDTVASHIIRAVRARLASPTFRAARRCSKLFTRVPLKVLILTGKISIVNNLFLTFVECYVFSHFRGHVARRPYFGIVIGTKLGFGLCLR